MSKKSGSTIPADNSLTEVHEDMHQHEHDDCCDHDHDHHHHHAVQTPVRYSTPKIGRNDPCTCGSGKKFKKCCGVAA